MHSDDPPVEPAGSSAQSPVVPLDEELPSDELPDDPLSPEELPSEELPDDAVPELSPVEPLSVLVVSFTGDDVDVSSTNESLPNVVKMPVELPADVLESASPLEPSVPELETSSTEHPGSPATRPQHTHALPNNPSKRTTIVPV